jgi:hypothetical protein
MNLHVGDPERNIWGAPVSDIMRFVRQGTLKHANHLMFACLTAKGTKRLDDASWRFHRQHRQSERKTFPPLSLVKGIYALARISAEEQAGVVFTLCCMLQQKDVWGLFDDTLRSQNLDVQDVQQLLECLLCFDAWTRQNTFWASDDLMAARRAGEGNNSNAHCSGQPRNSHVIIIQLNHSCINAVELALVTFFRQDANKTANNYAPAGEDNGCRQWLLGLHCLMQNCEE